MFTIPILPQNVTVIELANQCRSAALGFMAGSRSWTKQELSVWLGATYEPLTIGQPLRRAPMRRLTPSWGTVIPIASAPKRVNAEALATVVTNAHSFVLSALRELATGDAVRIGSAAIHRGIVARCLDETGALGWAPVASTRMRLGERVLALFAADLLLQPHVYEHELEVCEGCEAVRFTETGCLCRHSDTHAFQAISVA